MNSILCTNKYIIQEGRCPYMNANWENYLKYGVIKLDQSPQQIIQPAPSQQSPQQPIRRGGCCGRK